MVKDVSKYDSVIQKQVCSSTLKTEENISVNLIPTFAKLFFSFLSKNNRFAKDSYVVVNKVLLSSKLSLKPKIMRSRRARKFCHDCQDLAEGGRRVKRARIQRRGRKSKKYGIINYPYLTAIRYGSAAIQPTVQDRANTHFAVKLTVSSLSPLLQ